MDLGLGLEQVRETFEVFGVEIFPLLVVFHPEEKLFLTLSILLGFFLDEVQTIVCEVYEDAVLLFGAVGLNEVVHHVSTRGDGIHSGAECFSGFGNHTEYRASGLTDGGGHGDALKVGG